MIPEKTQTDIKKGNWLIHEDEDNIVQVWGSNLNGKEKVYLNDVLVSEKRNLKLKGNHTFNDNKGNNYEVKIKTESITKGVVSVEIIKNDTSLKTFTTHFVRGKWVTKQQLIFLIVSALLPIFFLKLNLFPKQIKVAYFPIVTAVLFLMRDPGKIILEE